MSLAERLRSFQEKLRPTTPAPENERAALVSGYAPKNLEPSARLAGDGQQSAWPLWTVVPAGTVFYKGTSNEDATPEQPHPFTWFTRGLRLAATFANQYEDFPGEESCPRIHRYVLQEDLHLPLIGSKADMNRFTTRFGVSLEYPMYAARDVQAAGLPGWVALDQYGRGKGDDILIGDVSCLRYECSFDGAGHPLEPTHPTHAR